MKLSREQMDEILDEVRPSVLQGVKDDFQRMVHQEILSGARTEISAMVKEWVKENILPEVEKELVESKEGLVSVGKKMAQEIVVEFAKKMTEDVKKRLENEWDRRKILGALFNM